MNVSPRISLSREKTESLPRSIQNSKSKKQVKRTKVVPKAETSSAAASSKHKEPYIIEHHTRQHKQPLKPNLIRNFEKQISPRDTEQKMPSADRDIKHGHRK
jgi:hypothetical protein